MKSRTLLSRGLLPLLAALALVALLPPAVHAAPPAGSKPADLKDPVLVERGRYLVMTSACHDCHTPFKDGPQGPEPDWDRMLSGHPESVAVTPPSGADAFWVTQAAWTNTAWSGPWGVSFTANLTPDAESGLGKWSFETFKETIRTGRHKGRGRDVLPPMPIAMYKHFNDADLEAIFSYLQSIPAIPNRVPAPLPPS